MTPIKKGNKERDGPSEGRQRKDNEGRQRRSRGGGSNGVGGNNVRARVLSETSEDCCSVCLFKFQIYSVGECNHPVCHVCSTRMRVLCQRNECAICRQDLPKVVFTHMFAKYETLKDNIYQMDRKYKICFEDDSIQAKYHSLLDHMCPECPEQPTFKTFRQLDLHIRKEHEMYYCDLCVTNLRIFTSERKHYTRKDLVHHRRKGDVDNTSHKGHPLCEFCDTRFFDNDELFKHLRKDHYFCHFCDADGIHLYFSDYKELRAHFDKDHYLCTEEHCEHEKFTSVFRTEIDMKAHKIDQHRGGLGKAATKQNRIVDVEFNYARREQPGMRDREDRGEGRGRGRGRGGYRGDRHGTRTPEPEPEGAREPVESVPNLAEDFPSLFEAAQEYGNAQSQGGGLASKVAMSSGHNVQSGGASWSNKGGAAPNLEEEFPGLPGAAPASNAPPPKPYGVKQQQKQQVKHKNPTEDFPGLPPSAKQSKGSNRPKSANLQKGNDFPSLGQSKPLANLSASRASSAPKTSPTPQPATARHTPQRIKDEEEDFSWSSDRDFVSAYDPTTQGNLKLIKSINSNCDNSDSSKSKSGKCSASLIKSDFPGLGAPEKKLTDFVASNSSGKNKNKNKKQNNSVSRKTVHAAPEIAEKTSLNSIASFLGADEKKDKKESAPQPQIITEKVKEQPPPKSAKPTPSPEPLYRPSKEKKSENLEAVSSKTKKELKLETEDFPTLGGPAKKVTAKDPKLDSEDFPTLGGPARKKPSKDVKLDSEDFPTLGGPSKKMTANFPKSDKKVAKTAAPSSKSIEVKQSKSSPNPSSTPRSGNASKSAPPPQKIAPLPAKARHAPERNAKEVEEDFSWSSERDFVSAFDPTAQGNLKLIKSVNCDNSNSSGNIKKNVKLDKDDFPSLGGPAKKINANFVKAQDKLVKTATPNSQWTDDKLASSFKENNTPVENRQTKGSVSTKSNKAATSSQPDFPSLDAPQKSAPPGFSAKAPPGFSNGAKPPTIKAPPGFSHKVLGEKNKNKTYLYHHPDSFQDRNAALINTISTLLGGKSLEFKKFRELSVSFRAGSLAPSDYYQECGALVSKKEFSSFFPELVALLPDIKKQQSLLSLHNALYPHSGLTSCSICDQVLLEQDHSAHENSHALEEDFPALGF